MTKIAGEARILDLAKKLRVKIITKKEGKDDRQSKNEKVLSHRL